VESCAAVHMDTVDFTANGSTHSGYCMAPLEDNGLDGYIALRHRKDGTAVTLDDGGVVITEKLSELLDLKAGDTMTITRDDVRYNVTISDITENYVYHYVYMSAATYEEIFGESASMNELLVKSVDSSDDTVNTVSSELLKYDAVSYVATFNNISNNLRKSMSSINYVVAIILVSAAALAFVVLYNLNNINIAERQKELATIKVLGFFDHEVSWYIMRENVFLTLLGTALGLFGGRYMLEWLITSVEVDVAMFNRQAGASCYILAAVMTVGFAVIVNFLGHMKMKGIDMIESLKSAE
jgi:putative ABC transport system permease protein